MPSDILGHNHRQAGAALLQDILRPHFHRIIDAAENAGDGRGLQALCADIGGDADNLVLIEG
ncbi:hypothetical protein D3C72_1286560 [compost metagenome]